MEGGRGEGRGGGQERGGGGGGGGGVKCIAVHDRLKFRRSNYSAVIDRETTLRRHISCPRSDSRAADLAWNPSLPEGLNRLVGRVVKASASRPEDPGFESRMRREFSGSIHTSDLKIGTSVANLPGAWRYRVSAGTGRPGVSIL